MTTRRGFLASAAVGLTTLLARKHLVAFGAPDGARRKATVIVMQRGAVDGLAMVPPHGDPLLATTRPTLKPASVTDLDGYWGLHPGLAALAPHFAAKRLAIVPAVGLPGASRSHFEAQDLLEQGGEPGATGWANRLRSKGAPNDTATIAVGNTLPKALGGREPALVIEASGEIGVARKVQRARRDLIVAALNELYESGTDPFSATARRALASAARVEKALAAVPAKTQGPRDPMGQALMTAARLLRADLGAELIVIDTTGWDTHTQQAPRLERGLGQLGGAIAAFATELGDQLADVTLVTISEFGRTVRENGTGGTDHGTGTTSLVLGGSVNGGRVVGTFPGLREDQRFEGRDVAIATDVRDLLADVLALAPDVAKVVFPNHEMKKLDLAK